MLTNQQALSEIVYGSTAPFERHLEQNPGSDPQLLTGQMQEARYTALREIIAPEGLVEAGKRIVAQTAEEAGAGISASAGRMTEAGEELKAGSRHVDEAQEAIRVAGQLSQQMRELVSSGRFNTDDVHYLIYQLRNRGEGYTESMGVFGRTYGAASESAQGSRVMLARSGEELEGGRNRMNRMEGRAAEDPTTVFGDNTVDKVGQRGTTTIAEHKASCGQEFNKDRDEIGAASDKAAEVGETVFRFSHGLADISKNLTDKTYRNSSQLTDTLGGLQRLFYQAEQYGFGEMANMIGQSMNQLDDFLRQLGNELATDKEANQADIQKATEIVGQIQGLRREPLFQH
jgi:hypothetical protein